MTVNGWVIFSGQRLIWALYTHIRWFFFGKPVYVGGCVRDAMLAFLIFRSRLWASHNAGETQLRERFGIKVGERERDGHENLKAKMLEAAVTNFSEQTCFNNYYQ